MVLELHVRSELICLLLAHIWFHNVFHVLRVICA